jgi:predicted Fe-S protein YdhL (DUF1289 family)
MLFSPCRGGENCSTAGTHCSGCGREHGEIRETREIIQAVVLLARKQGYQNPDEFVRFIGDKALKKISVS